MIQTVNGPISSKNLGITMCHEHLALDLSRIRCDDDSRFDNDKLIINEIKKMQTYGVKTVIEVTCNDMGRDVKKLQYYSNKCGLNIIAATGFYLEEYHPNRIRSACPEEICEIFCKDILEGIDGTNIKAGVIGEVASGERCIRDGERNVLIAAALAQKKTGLPITTHCQLGKLGMAQIKLFDNYGANLEKVVLGHLDLANDKEYYEEILKTGANIGFDTIGKTAYLSDEVRANNLLWLLDHGWEDKIVLSQDISRKSYMSYNEKQLGYTAVMKKFVPLLEKAGVNRILLNKLLIDNPARIFNIEN